jgi:hypothetical protein
MLKGCAGVLADAFIPAYPLFFCRKSEKNKKNIPLLRQFFYNFAAK